MQGSLLIAVLLAHFIADFVLQPDSLCNMKYSSDPRRSASGLLRHSIIHGFIVLLAAINYFWSPLLVFFTSAYVLLHYLTDKKRIRYDLNNLNAFLADQMFHIVVVIFLVLIFARFLNPAPWLSGNFDELGFTVAELLNRIFIIVILLILGVPVTGILIRLYFKQRKEKVDFYDTGAPDGGYQIGVLERLLVISAVATNNAAWAGLILGVKSVARFRRFKDDAFVEYFLIGSFLSFFAAFITGFIIQRMLISLLSL